MKKPTPIHRETVCSVCGLEWGRHGETPTLETCVDLLAADLAAEKLRTTPTPPYIPYPVSPWPRPLVPQPLRPWPYYPNISGTAASSPAITWQSNTGGNVQ